MGRVMQRRNPQSGMSLIEVMLAAAILTICSLGMIGLIGGSIASNTRNKFDSTTTMLAQSIIEQINSTVIGSETASLTDCSGTVWEINTAPGGAELDGDKIDFTEADPPDDYHMDFTVKSPCEANGIEQAVYDVRWNVEIVGAAAGTPTTTYLLTVGATLKDHGEGNQFFAAPVNLRIMIGN